MTVVRGRRGHPGTARPGRRWWIAGMALAAALALGAAVLWFQPHTLFIDERVDEALPPPAVAAGPAAPGDQPAPVPAPPHGGTFVSLDHGTSGTVRVLTAADGTQVVRLEGLDTSNGPDLFVYLSASPPDGPEGAFDDEYVSLGRLKGNKGDQNYAVPAGVDVAQFASVVIWCDRFDSAFGAADLRPAGAA